MIKIDFKMRNSINSLYNWLIRPILVSKVAKLRYTWATTSGLYGS